MKSIIVLLVSSTLLTIGSCNLNPITDISDSKAIGTTAQLTFSSFDGGGPSYNIVLDSDIVSYEIKRVYNKSDHTKARGSGYKVVYTFTGIKEGQASMTIEERSTIAKNIDHQYTVKVDENLNVQIQDATDPSDKIETPQPVLVIKVNGKVFYANLEDNSSAKEFIEKLSSQAIDVEMEDYGNFEKVGQLPWTISTNDSNITTEPGDVILYQGDKLTLYYDQNTWDFTKIAKIDNVTKEELLETLGNGNVTVNFSLEWSVIYRETLIN